MIKGRCLIGLNNVELITDRSRDQPQGDVQCKKKYPNHCRGDLMVESKRRRGEIVKHTGRGCDVQLNWLPSRHVERGMRAAMGQVPSTHAWYRNGSRGFEPAGNREIDVTSHIVPRIPLKKGGADAVSLINTINSVMGVDVDTLIPYPNVNGMAAHGGYCGTAVKPIALNMVSELARDPEFNIPISGIGGINTWRDAVEFILLGAANVQVCTAVMHTATASSGDRSTA
jgi:dihydropyrimidine dehydrogenase (NAD+) subunit PreA